LIDELRGRRRWWSGCWGGGHGEAITTITTTSCTGDVDFIVHAALRRGGLPSLEAVAANLTYKAHRAALTEGLLGGMHKLRLKLACNQAMRRQLDALGLVRQLPALDALEVQVEGYSERPVQWPPFIPRTLKTLHLEGGALSRSLVQALPGMLGASGARLERLVMIICLDSSEVDDTLGHLTQALRCCSPELKNLQLLMMGGIDFALGSAPEDHADQAEHLRVHLAKMLACVSACRELKCLELYTLIEPFFPPGTAFGRLTHLHLCAYEREHPPEAGVVGLWELLASGGLPALATLRVRGRRWRRRSRRWPAP
jgi:hypothetical protein